MGIKTQFKNIKSFFQFCYLEIMRKQLMKRLKKRKKIKIVFLGYALGGSCDLFSNIYYEFKKDKRFEPYVIIVPNSYGEKHSMLELQNQAKQYLDNLKIPYICGYDSYKDSFFDMARIINPDIVFMCHHYDWFPKEFRIESFAKKLVYITPYSFILTNNYVQHSNSTAYLLAHRCFFESNDTAILWRNVSAVKRNKDISKFLGYLKIDNLLFNKGCKKNVWKISDNSVKRIIWAPHHLDAPISNFLEYHELFFNLAKTRKDIQFAFRPHPGLKGSLYRIAGWSEQKINTYFNKWQSLPNAFISEGDFVDVFMSSDAMILDSISFIAEYFLTGKPILIQKPKQKDFPFNEFCEKLKKASYEATNWNDIINFIDDVVLQNDDPKKTERLAILKTTFVATNNQPAFKNIYKSICDEIYENKLNH